MGNSTIRDVDVLAMRRPTRMVCLFRILMILGLGSCTGAWAAEFETGSIQLDRTINSAPGNTAWETVTLQATYSVPPVVIAGPVTHNNDHSLSVRIRNVTTTDFEIALTSPCDSADADPNAAGNPCPPPAPGNSPPWATETVRYLVVPPGVWQFPDGTKIEAASQSVSAVRSFFGSSSAGDPVTFQHSYAGRPVVLHSVNTTNDSDWIASSVFGPGNNIGNPPDSSGFTIALEGAEVTTAHGAETIGWVAIEPANGTNNGHDYFANLTPGLDVDRHDDGCFALGSFSGFGGLPDVVASHNTMSGSNGAWARYCGNEIETTRINVHVDEDQVNDGERTGIPEALSWFAFEADSIGLLVEAAPVPPLVEYRMDESAWSGADSVLDNTGNGRHGSPVNGAMPDDASPLARPGNPGTCGYGTFDGTDQGVDDADAGNYLNGLGEITVTAWVYNTDSLSGNDRGIFFTDDPSADKDHRLGIRYDTAGANGGGNNILKAGVQTTACNDADDCVQVETQSNVMVQNQWQHVAMTWESGGDLRVYVDGVDVTGDGTGDINQGTGGTIDAVASLQIAEGAKGDRWQGRIDEFRIYDRALTPAQIQGVFLDTHPCPLTADDVQAGRVTLNDTGSNPTFKSVCFDNTFPQTPLVFAMTDDQDPDPAEIRIRNVTPSGFEIAQVEPQGEDGTSGSTTIDFVAIVPGEYSVGNGAQLIADSISTTTQQGRNVGGTGWETPTFASAFDAPPAILARVQTMNNESGSPAPPGGPSVPWLTTAIRNVGNTSFDIALERAETSGGTVSQAETIGYLAIEAGRSGPLTNTIDFESIRSDDVIRGHDNGCFTVNFAGSYGTEPLVVATQTTRDGGDGGWVRRCSLSTGQVGLLIDEDRANDGERNHTTERAGILVLSGSFGSHVCPAATVDHYAIGHDGTGVTCLAEAITITAHAVDHSAVDAGTAILDLATTTGRGDWSTVIAGGGVLNNGAQGDGAATYTFPGGESGVTLAFNYTNIPSGNSESFFFDVTDGTASDLGNGNVEDPEMTFARTGFRFFNATDGNTIIPTQIAGKPSDVAPNAKNLVLQAIRSSDEDPTVCEPAFPDGSSRTIELAAECRNSATCAGNQVSINGNTVTTNDDNGGSATGSYTPVTLSFGPNAAAPLSLEYFDAGLMQLHARFDIPLEDGTPSGDFMLGSSNDYVVRPFGFDVTVAGNPGATDANGPVFTAAGEDFDVTATAVAWQPADDGDNDGIPDGHEPGDADAGNNASLGDNTVTPNFGQEATSATVQLSARLDQPAGGSTGALTGGTGLTGFSGGAATGTVQYTEVGIIEIRADTTDYLGGGADATGMSGYTGRFIPFDFDVTQNSPVFGTACGTGYTYIGEGFTYDTVPVLTVTARALGGTTTQNYTADFFKLTQSSLTVPGGNKGYATASGTLDTAMAPAKPAVADSGNGVGTLTFSDGGGVTFVRNAPEAPFNAEISLAIDVIDEDGVVYGDGAGASLNPARFGQPTAGNGMDFSAGKEQRWGRLRLLNAAGSELLALGLPMRTEYFDGTAFVANTDDDCSGFAVTDLVLSNDIESGQSDGDIIVSNAPSCTTTGETTASIANNPFVDGDAGLSFSAPGEGCTGYADVTVPLGAQGVSYLQFDWDGDGSHAEDPAGRATFGIFSGPDEFIYIREPW